MHRCFLQVLMAFVVISLSSNAWAAEIECYDAKVRAKPIAQIPTAFPYDPDIIVISWPWFIDLRVRRVIDGELPQKQITALAVIHSAYISKTRTWLLRRNTLGGFNVLRINEPDSVPRCDADVEPAQPYLRPEEGRSLEDYRREGEGELRRYYDDEAE